MLPFLPPFNQVQQHGAAGASQQGIPSNPHSTSAGNSGGNFTLQPCQFPMAAQYSFGNRNSNWNNSGSFPHRPSSGPAACFSNAIVGNHLLAQISQQGMNQFGYFPHGHPGHLMQNLNQLMAASASMQSNGQFLLQGGLGNMGQVMPVQYAPMPMAPLNFAAPPNYIAQAQGSQNYGTVNGNMDGGVVHNKTNQIYNQGPTDVHPPNMGQTAMLEPHSTDHQQQFSDFSSKSQMNQGRNGRYSNSNFKQRPGNKNFHRNQYDASKLVSQHSGSWKPHFNQNEGSFQPRNGRKGRQHMGKSNSSKFDRTPMSEPRRTAVPLNYTEEEIRKWREERKKNFPTKSNIEKKVSDKQSNKDVFELDTKIRRQQLKEILEKQAQLGVEVAEIPPIYLSEPENQVSETRGERGWRHKRGKFGNKFDKRSRSGFKDNWHNKKQKFGHKSSPDAVPKRNPTLLEKLLITDMKRDKSHLLQAFRFMVLNSFFKDWPEKSLEFPLVGIKDGIGETSNIEEEPSSRNEDLIDSRVGDSVIDEDGDDDDDDNDDAVNVGTEIETAYSTGKIGQSDSEEGEITD